MIAVPSAEGPMFGRACHVLIAGLIGLSGTAVFAQAPLGSVRGTVVDAQRAVLPGATITATTPDAPGVFTATSDANGEYRLVDLPPGTYTVTVELPGFATFTRESVIVRAGLNVLLDVELKVGAVSEAIQVTGDSPLIESKQPVQAVNIAGDFQRNVPIL